MKRVAFWFAMLLVQSFNYCKEKTESTETNLLGKPMPSFNILLMDSITQINTSDIKKGKPTVFLFISPYCPHCKKQIEEIASGMQTISNFNIYILSTFPFESIRSFYYSNRLEGLSKINVGINNDSIFPRYFGITRIPFIAIYGKDKMLKEIHAGIIKIREIKSLALR